jgi:uncharacterized protein (TIGR03118 family)
MRTLRMCVCAGLLFGNFLTAATFYYQTNLTSDIPGLAANTDPNLKNPWGMSFGPTSPFWVSNQVSGNTTLYTGAGANVLLGTAPNQFAAVATPPAAPTGQVFNSTNGFVEGDGAKAVFMFVTLAGTIDAWNPADGNTAEMMHQDTAAYTGATLAGNNLYVANFSGGGIDAYDANFHELTLSGSFVDPNLPSGYSPYNVENVNGQLYVEYVQVNPTTHRPQPGAGLGRVAVFDANGNFVKELITGGALNAPWGITMAPSNFGTFSNDLLVGNFGNGQINAFDPVTGAFLGTLSSANGSPITDSGLWALKFRPGGPGVNPNALYFTAGINNEADGLFGSIQASPEPGTLALLLLAGCVIGVYRRSSAAGKL